MKRQKTSWYLSKLLFYLGFSPRAVGYRYIKEIVFLFIDTDCLKLNDVYSAVARSFSQTPELIASSVRNALKQANNNALDEKLECLIGVGVFNKNYSVTVGEFFGLISTYLKYCWDGVNLELPINDL